MDLADIIPGLSFFLKSPCLFFPHSEIFHQNGWRLSKETCRQLVGICRGKHIFYLPPVFFPFHCSLQLALFLARLYSIVWWEYDLGRRGHCLEQLQEESERGIVQLAYLRPIFPGMPNLCCISQKPPLNDSITPPYQVLSL